MSTQTYEAAIAGLLEDCLVKYTSPLSALFDALGCPYVPYHGGDFTLQTPPPPPADAEDLVRRTLVRTLRETMRIFGPNKSEVASIFAGLCQHGRWRECLQTNDDAYALAVGVTCFLLAAETEKTAFKEMLTLEVIPGVRALLNEWIEPATLLTNVPDARVVARLLFGDAWCTLVLDNEDPDAFVFGVIRTHRPAFMPGLLPAHLESQSVVLPNMDIAA